VLVWLVVHNLSEKDKNEILNSISIADYKALFIPAILNTISNILRAIRWKQLFNKQEKPSVSNAFYALMVGYLANYGLPRMGEITRCAILKKYNRIPVETGLGTVVVERIIDMLTLLALLVIVVIWQYETLFVFLGDFKDGLYNKLNNINPVYALSGLLLVIAGMAMTYWFMKRKGKIQSKLTEIVKGFMKGLSSVKTIENPLKFYGITVVIWFIYIITILLSFRTLPETSMLGFAAASAVLVFSTFGGIIVQAGFAAYPFIVMEVVKQYGTASGPGFALGWILWFNQLAIILVIGVLSLILLPLTNKKHNEEDRLHPIKNS
jgi:uncharacterized protein (TIRG00374 family)